MNLERARLLQLKLVLLDASTTAIAFVLAYWVRGMVLSERLGEIYPPDRYLGVALMAVVSLPLLMAVLRGYVTEGALDRRPQALIEPWKLVKALGLEYVLLSAIVFSLRLQFLSRLLVVLFVAFAGVLLVLARLGLWSYLYRRAHREPLRIVVVGSGKNARALAATLSQKPRLGTVFLGFVVEHGAVLDSLDAQPVLGNVAELESILKSHVVDEVVFVLPERSSSELEPLLSLCERLGITARLACDFLPRGGAHMSVERVGDTPLLTFTTVPTDSTRLALKRVVDVLGSLVLLVLASPILAVVPFLIKLTSRGPVFYKQIRCGLNGRKFTFYKFRSMVDGADEQRDEVAHLNEAKGPIFKISSDPRVTPVGKILRKTSIDELPQLINVLKGEMSLVGPRPPLPEEVELYEPWQRRRMSMKPGITCLWQVSGRSALSFEEWVAMDLQYIDNWSLEQDFRILLRTVPAVLSRRGAW